MGITHQKVSAIPDGPDTDLVRPSDWNAQHVVSGYAEELFLARCYLRNFVTNNHQVINPGITARKRAMLDGVVTDPHGLFDRSTWSGTTTGAAANKLIDAGAAFSAHCVGAIVWNITTNAYSHVTAYDSPTELTLHDNIMGAGEEYAVYHCVFVAPKTAQYMVIGNAMFATLPQGEHFQALIRKQAHINAMPAGTAEAFAELANARSGRIGCAVLSVISLDAGNTIGLDIIHGHTDPQNLMRDNIDNGRYTWMALISLT